MAINLTPSNKLPRESGPVPLFLGHSRLKKLAPRTVLVSTAVGIPASFFEMAERLYAVVW